MKSYEWTLIQSDQCLYKKRKLGHIYIYKKRKLGHGVSGKSAFAGVIKVKRSHMHGP